MGKNCSGCLKNDVCNQKEFFEQLEKAIANITIGAGSNSVYHISTLKTNFDLQAVVICGKYYEDQR